MLVPPLELESNVSLWLSAVSQYKARVTFCSYSVMEMCTKGLGAQTGALRVSATLGYTATVVLPSTHPSAKVSSPAAHPGERRECEEAGQGLVIGFQGPHQCFCA